MYHYGGLNHENIDTLTLWQVNQLISLVKEIHDDS